MKKAGTIYCDFDGTITKKDAVNTFFEEFASPDWTKSEELWVKGKISSRENAIIQVGMVKEISENELYDFISSIEIDEYFPEFYALLKEKNIELVILSDGFDLFIEKTLERLNLTNVKYYANHLVHKNNNKFAIEFPYFENNCQKGSGMCKCLKVKEERFSYIGDGVSDLCIAQKAETLYASKSLLKYCETNKIKCIPFDSFRDIINCVNNNNYHFMY